MSNSKLTFEDVILVASDISTKRKADAELSNAGKAFLPLLSAHLLKAESQFPGISSGRPLVTELDIADEDHDDSGMAFWYLSEAYLVHPRVSEELKEAIRKWRSIFLVSPSELSSKYTAEAHAASKRKEVLGDFEAELKRIPVTLTGQPGGEQTAFEWVSGFLDAGIRIGEYLSARGDKAAKVNAALLRVEILGTLTAFRDALEREAKVLGNLPSDIVVRVFGYMDSLSASRGAGKKKGEEAKGEAGTEKAPA